MKIELKVLYVVGLLLVNVSAFKIEASGLDKWGHHGSLKDAIIIPDTDFLAGGNSLILDPSGGVVGPCPKSDATCTPQWNMSQTFVEANWVVNHFASKIKITDFVPSSKAGWGWAAAGWWVIPNYDATASGETAFDKAAPTDLTNDSWISMAISYTMGQTLTLQLKGEDIDENSGLQSPPRFSYAGKGSFEIINFPVKAIKRAGWSVPASYDASRVTAIGLLRLEAALSEGAQFPSSRPLTTDFKLKCMNSGLYKGDNACNLNSLPNSSSLNQSSSYQPSSEISSSSSYVKQFKIEASGLDEWGQHGVAKDAIIIPDTDFLAGGDSKVLDPSGSLIGPCPTSDKSCIAQWNISNSFVEVDWTINHLSSKLQITNFVPSSRSGWGWSTAGWWLLPNYDNSLSGSSVFDKAKPAGLSSASWLSMEVSYTSGQTLTVELKGEDIDYSDGLQSPPRFSYVGKGSFEVIDFPMSAVKRAGWSVPATYDASKVNGVGFLRYEVALANGAQFPKSTPMTTDFKFRCFSMGSFKGDNRCSGRGMNISSIASSSNTSSFNGSSYIYSSVNHVSSNSNNPKNFKIEAKNLDEWGLHGDAKDAIIVPDADVFYGGNSALLDPTGSIVGPCPKNDATCTAQWNMSGTFVEANWATTHFSSELKITDYVPSSKSGWGWAYSGWWVVPNYDATAWGETAFDKAGSAGLDENSWLSMAVSYTKGQVLTLELKGEDIDKDDGMQSPPRFSYVGTGTFDVVNFPVKSIKRGAWSNPATYDASKVNGIGLLRMEAALSEGANFPSGAPERTIFEFSCLSSGRVKGENVCADNVTIRNISKIGYLADLSKSYLFKEFNIYLPYYISGNPISYSTKSLLGKSNPRTSGSNLYVSSLIDKSGIDLIEVTAFNSAMTLKDTFMLTISSAVLPVLKDTIADIELYEKGNGLDEALVLSDYFTSESDVTYSISRIGSGSGPLPTIIDGKIIFPKGTGKTGVEVFEITVTNLDGSLKFRFKVNHNAGINPIISSGSHDLVGTFVKVYSIEGQEIWSGIWTETPMLVPGSYIIKSNNESFRFSIK